jgi:hypothetical protein
MTCMCGLKNSDEAEMDNCPVLTLFHSLKQHIVSGKNRIEQKVLYISSN